MEARVVVRGQTGAQCQMMMMKVMRRLMLWRRWQCSTESPTSSTYWPQFPFSLLQFHSPWSSFLIWLAYSPHHHPILSSSHSFIPPILLKTTLASVCVCVCECVYLPWVLNLVIIHAHILANTLCAFKSILFVQCTAATSSSPPSSSTTAAAAAVVVYGSLVLVQKCEIIRLLSITHI